MFLVSNGIAKLTFNFNFGLFKRFLSFQNYEKETLAGASHIILDPFGATCFGTAN